MKWSKICTEWLFFPSGKDSTDKPMDNMKFLNLKSQRFINFPMKWHIQIPEECRTSKCILLLFYFHLQSQFQAIMGLGAQGEDISNK